MVCIPDTITHIYLFTYLYSHYFQWRSNYFILYHGFHLLVLILQPIWMVYRLIFGLLITGVGALVILYSIYYMSKEREVAP